MGVAEAERDLITSINANTAALRGWRGEYDINQALTEGRAVSSPSDDTTTNGDSGNRLTASDSGIVNISTQAPRLQDVSIDYVPYQNLPEVPVLTATEVKNEQRSPAITITGNSFSIREEADVDRVASALLQKIELAEGRG